ncbi:MAG: acyl-CoA dehydratase activase [bacterium]|jgi:predicted CoA-substrate-specific enzyme activase|nr:acyl-CoA dehydratase activase [bacterium]
MRKLGVDIGAETLKTVILDEEGSILDLRLVEVQGRALYRLNELLSEMNSAGLLDEEMLFGITGNGRISGLGSDEVDETSALAAACSRYYPDIRTLVEMGRETQRFIHLARNDRTGRLVVEDSSMGSKCAAGSGSFLDHMHRRLNFLSLTEFADTAYQTDNPATLSGRCAVFTESDIVHLYQKGTPRERIAAGIHQAICRNYSSGIARGKDFEQGIALIGGVAANKAVIKYLAQEIGLTENDLFVPENYRHLGAIGAALKAAKSIVKTDLFNSLNELASRPFSYARVKPLKLRLSQVMGSKKADGYRKEIETAALGVDIGSVSTKAVLITREGNEYRVLASYYRKTDGDPLTAVQDVLAHIEEQSSDYHISRIVAGTTGSGRYLTGDYIGADIIRNEITAQANGAMIFAPEIDTILEIGGQDSKYIRLNNGVLVDFEMNKACAAGCGAFLEKQAARLGIPIEEFGDLALKGSNPPELDWNCTVFTESAILFFQQNNVPQSDLCAGICLASVKNYLHKNIGNRVMGDRIAFQGAVAFNTGMVAAFETLLGKKIVVPPYPHLTGAVGVAGIAYDNCPENTSFKGFSQLAGAVYNVSSFECKSCPNNCDVNTFQIEGGPKYFYNDRCEKYSAVHKKVSDRCLPDLFAEREEMLMNVCRTKPLPGAPRVGIPRGLMFEEYFPLFAGFFAELGFDVVPSAPTNKSIVRDGIRRVMSEPCYPVKVAHGHVADVIKKGVDYLFMPRVINAEINDESIRQSYTCPYVQAGPDLTAAALRLDENSGVNLLSPCFFFKRGEGHVIRVLGELGRELGFGKSATDKAVKAGMTALKRLHDWVEARGSEIYQKLGDEEEAFIVIGRPYTLYDKMVNMDIGKKIRDLGIPAIPMDFLPLSKERSNDVWPNIFSRQIQKKLAAAKLLKRDKRLRAVILTYFGCGPDSFANIFFREEMNMPCYAMQLDEHTADAGVITRLEAFADTSAAAGNKERKISATDTPLAWIKGKRLWLPYASEGARVLAGVMRAFDIDADVLPLSKDSGLNLARSHISEDVCVPMLYTTQDIIERVMQPDFNPRKEAFFQGASEGPCRYGMYYMLQKDILARLGLEEVNIVTLGNSNYDAGYGIEMSLLAWDALVAHDMMEKMLHHARPYERTAGTADAIFERNIQALCELLPRQRCRISGPAGRMRLLNGTHLTLLIDLLHSARDEFASICDYCERPLVGVVGEFYVRIHARANQNVMRKVEAAGGEAWLAPLTEFFGYSNLIGGILHLDAFRDTWSWEDLKDGITKKMLAQLAVRDEHSLFNATLPFMNGFDDISPQEVIANGSNYLHRTIGGEAICSMGKAEDFAMRGLAGVISVIPFNCMPGNIAASLGHKLRRFHNGIPFLSLDYDGFADAGRDARLAAFMAQAHDIFACRG